MSTSRTPEKYTRILRSREEVQELRAFWASCHTHRDADLDFFLFVVDLFPEVLRPHVVVVYEQGQPVAILAGRLEISALPVKLGYLNVRIPTMRVIQISGWLGESEKYAELLAENLFQSFQRREADVACFRYIDISSALAIHIRRAPRLCADFLAASHLHWFCDRKARESFLTCLSKNERAQQKRRERKIAQTFKSYRIEVFSVEQIAQLVHDAEEVAKKSYQRRMNVGFSDTPEIRARLEYDMRKGWLAGYILYLDDKPCAFWIGSLRNRVFLSNYLGFDPAYSQYSPGMYLMIKVMEALSTETNRQHADRIDFGVGDAIYKRRLSNHNREEALLHIFALRPGPILGNLLHSTMRCFSVLGKGLRICWRATKRALAPATKPFSA